jgi:hypothetical protein
MVVAAEAVTGEIADMVLRQGLNIQIVRGRFCKGSATAEVRATKQFAVFPRVASDWKRFG